MDTLKSKLAKIAKEIEKVENKSFLTSEERTLQIERLKRQKNLLRKNHIESKKGRCI